MLLVNGWPKCQICFAHTSNTDLATSNCKAHSQLTVSLNLAPAHTETSGVVPCHLPFPVAVLPVWSCAKKSSDRKDMNRRLTTPVEQRGISHPSIGQSSPPRSLNTIPVCAQPLSQRSTECRLSQANKIMQQKRPVPKAANRPLPFQFLSVRCLKRTRQSRGLLLEPSQEQDKCLPPRGKTRTERQATAIKIKSMPVICSSLRCGANGLSMTGTSKRWRQVMRRRSCRRRL